jgi:prevent-host-death family protein
MDEIAMSEFRRQAGEFVNQTYYAGKAFILTKGDKRVAALVPVTVLDRLTELEALHGQTILQPPVVDQPPAAE